MKTLSLEQLRRDGVQEILCRGYHDTESGWEFDAPLVMVEPILRDGCPHRIENLVEGLMIDLAVDGEVRDTDAVWTADGLTNRARAEVHMRRLDHGHARRGLVLWERNIRVSEIEALVESAGGGR